MYGSTDIIEEDNDFVDEDENSPILPGENDGELMIKWFNFEKWICWIIYFSFLKISDLGVFYWLLVMTC